MNRHHKLSPFRKIFKSTIAFYKANGKKLLYLFLPIEIVVVISLICIDIIPDSDSIILALLVGLFSLTTFIFGVFSKFLVFDAPEIVERINEGERPLPKTWYKSVIKKIVPLAVVMFSVAVLNFIFVFLVMMSAGILFLFVSFLSSRLLEGGTFSILLIAITVAVLLYFSLRFIIKFFVGSIFSVYMYIFEGRRGLDAVASSFLLTSKRQFKIFWRIAIIWILSAIPFVVLVFPINASIAANNLADIYEAFLIHKEPILSNPGIFVSVVLDVFTSLASLLSATFFVTFSYFLWKDVKATTYVFHESEYTKTRNHLRRFLIIGTIATVALIALSFIADSVLYSLAPSLSLYK